MGQGRRRYDRRVGNVDAVVHLVAFLQSPQDGDRVLDAGLFHQHFLEASLQRRVLLDVLAVFVESGGADAVELAAGQRGFEHIAGVHGARGLAGADHRVQLVDEQNNQSLLLGEIVQHRLQAFLEFAAELGSGDEGAQVQRQQALAFQALGHLAVDDALGKPLDDGGLADAGLTDEHRVVLGAPLQHLDGAADFVVPADDRIQLALLGALGEVDGVLFQRLALLFGICVVDRLAAAHLLDGSLERRSLGRVGFEQLCDPTLGFQGREHEQLAGYVLVLALLGELVHDVHDPPELVGDLHVAAGALHLGQLIQGHTELRSKPVDVDVCLGEQVAHAAALLVEQCRHHMDGLDELVIAPDGQTLGIRQGHLEFGR